MAQNTQTLKTEIMASLDFLSPESLKLLAKFVSFLRAGNVQTEIEQVVDTIDLPMPQQVIRIPSPRLVHRRQVADFQKEVVEITE
ncbi:MAG TPA: hypothetical protein P5121_24515 [Caldilineaceae bacterium]|nr:hypothetical protein [Caldilineaceae bacterium]